MDSVKGVMEKFVYHLTRKRMFKKRVLTALVLLPLVLGAIWVASHWEFFTLLLILLAAMSKECALLIPIKQKTLQGLFVLAVLLSWLVLHWFFISYIYIVIVLLTSILLWSFLSILIWNFPRSQKIWDNPWVLAI